MSQALARSLDPVPIVEAFFQSHSASHFAEDGEWLDMALNRAAHGHAQIAEMIGQWYAGDFADARDEPLNLVVTDDTVVAEWTFHGRPYKPATSSEESLNAHCGDAIAVPMVAVFEVHGRVIQRVRLYYDLARRSD